MSDRYFFIEVEKPSIMAQNITTFKKYLTKVGILCTNNIKLET